MTQKEKVELFLNWLFEGTPIITLALVSGGNNIKRN